jgi:hypothetical protein
MNNSFESTQAQNNFTFPEKHVEQGLSITRSNSNKYSVIMICLIIFTTLGAHSIMSALPLFLYEDTYLCKLENSSILFTEICKKSFVCDVKNKINIDYILDKNRSMRSLISDYDIFCSDTKITLFGISFFIFGSIGVIINPYLIKSIGTLNDICLNVFTNGIFYLLLLLIKNYYVGLICFSLMMTNQVILIITIPFYIVEMSKPKQRSTFMCCFLIMMSISGLFCNMIAYLTNSYNKLLIALVAILVVSPIFLKLFLVDSIRSLYIRGRYKEVLDNLEYIAKVNNSSNEYFKWKETLLKEHGNNHRHISYINEENKENSRHHSVSSVNSVNEQASDKLKEINFWSIWCIKSQVKNIILFTLASFINQFNLLFFQLEMKKTDNFFRDTSIAFVIDIFGYIFGGLIMECPIFKRKITFTMINFFGFATCYANGIVLIFSHFTYISFVNRFNNSAYFIVFQTFNFETYPTLIRSHATSVNRLLSRICNVWTAIIMVNVRPAAYFFIGSFMLAVGIFLVCADVQETKDKVIEEFPIEFKDKQDDCIGDVDDPDKEKLIS